MSRVPEIRVFGNNGLNYAAWTRGLFISPYLMVFQSFVEWHQKPDFRVSTPSQHITSLVSIIVNTFSDAAALTKIITFSLTMLCQKKKIQSHFCGYHSRVKSIILKKSSWCWQKRPRKIANVVMRNWPKNWQTKKWPARKKENGKKEAF